MKLMLASVAILGVIAASVPNVEMAKPDSCASQCRAAHNQCRIAGKSYQSPQCDAQLQACMERCGRR
jgi:hypothetical protein